MEYRRQEMLEAKITLALRLRLYALDHTVMTTMEAISNPPIVPPTSYIAKLEPFQTLFKTLPLEEKVSHEHWSGLVVHSTIPRMTEAWRHEADLFLLGILSTTRTPMNPDAMIDRAPLELATTFFKCNWCTEPITYPRILMHGHLRNRRCKDADEEENEDGEERRKENESDENEAVEIADDNDHQPLDVTRNEVTVDTVWNKMSSWFVSGWNEGNDEIFVDEEATNFAKRIVRVCGEDPNTTTFSRMKELNSRLECVRCTAKSKNKTRKRLVMNWTTAVSHHSIFSIVDDYMLNRNRLATT